MKTAYWFFCCLVMIWWTCAQAVAATLTAQHHASENHASDSTLMLVARHYLEEQLSNLQGDFSIQIFKPPVNSPLCLKPKPFVYPNQRLIGSIVIGVRCETPQGEQSRFLRANIQQNLNYFQAKRNFSAGEPIDPMAFELKVAPANQLPRMLVTDRSQLIDQLAARPIAKGTILQQSALKKPLLIHRNDVLVAQAKGQGFKIITSAVALENAAKNQKIKVRLANGQLIEAQVISAKEVEIDL